MKASATDRKFPTLASKILDIGLVVFITFLEVLQSGIKKIGSSFPVTLDLVTQVLEKTGRLHYLFSFKIVNPFHANILHVFPIWYFEKINYRILQYASISRRHLFAQS